MTDFLRFTAILGVWVACLGCGPVYPTLEYDSATFMSALQSGEFNTVSTGELPVASQIQHAAVADLWFRLPDGTVRNLRDLPEAEARKISTREPSQVGDVTCYHLADVHGNLHYRKGTLIGAVLADRTVVAPNEKGPFVTLPATGNAVREVFGKWLREGSYRAPARWN